jgi:hypothetical protein
MHQTLVKILSIKEIVPFVYITISLFEHNIFSFLLEINKLN